MNCKNSKGSEGGGRTGDLENGGGVRDPAEGVREGLLETGSGFLGTVEHPVVGVVTNHCGWMTFPQQYPLPVMYHRKGSHLPRIWEFCQEKRRAKKLMSLGLFHQSWVKKDMNQEYTDAITMTGDQSNVFLKHRGGDWGY